MWGLKGVLCEVSESFTCFMKPSVHVILWCIRKDNKFVTINLLLHGCRTSYFSRALWRWHVVTISTWFDTLDKKYLVMFSASKLDLFIVRKEKGKKNKNSPLFPHVLAAKDVAGHYIWYQSKRLKCSDLRDSLTCRYVFNYVNWLYDIIVHTIKTLLNSLHGF